MTSREIGSTVGEFGDKARNTTRHFLSSEFPQGLPPLTRTPTIAALGTIAERAIASPLLRGALLAAQVRPRGFEAFTDPAAFKDGGWDLAIVLSPHKQSAVVNICDKLTPTAREAGVVDTLVRTDGGIVGVNTNAYSGASAAEILLNGLAPRKVLIAGTGASSRSMSVGLHRAFPQAEIGVIGRTNEKSAGVIADSGFGAVIEDPKDFAPNLIIHATTVGESTDEDSLAFDLNAAFSAGTFFFDLNNRPSSLQSTALAKGCVVMGGPTMQRITNVLRASLFQKG